MTDDKTKEKASQLPVSDDEQPEIYGIVKKKDGIGLNRRSFLGTIVASGVLATCGPVFAGHGEEALADLPQNCGSAKAHEGKIEGVLMQDKSLFSWDAKTLKIWEYTKGQLKKSLTKHRLKIRSDSFPELLRYIWDSPVSAYGADATTMATNSKDGVVLRSSLNAMEKGPKSSKTLLKGVIQPVRSLAFHPDGRTLAAGSVDGSVTFWSLVDNEVQQRIKGEAGAVLSLAIHPNGNLLLSGHKDGKMRLWQLPDGKIREEIPAHEGAVLNIKITCNGALAVTSGKDGRVKLWDMPEAKFRSVLAVPPSEKTTAMAVSPDNQLLATGSSKGHLYLWRLPEGAMIGCLFDLELFPEQGAQLSQHRQMGNVIMTQPCGTPLPADATCVCDCVGHNLSYRTTETVCICDTIAVPAGGKASGHCTCNLISVGVNCSCVGNVSHRSSHYWHPN